MDIERVVVRLMADATHYHRVMNAVERDLHRMARYGGVFASSTAASFAVLNRTLQLTTITMVGAGAVAVKLATDYQRIAVAFEVMTGSAAKAKELLDNINQLAIETPFRSGELMEGAKQLKAFGVETAQIMPTLRILGEVSAGTGTKLERIILAFGQIRVAGRLMGPELRQLIDAGVPMFDYLARVMGKPSSAIKGLVEEGKVGFPEVVRAFNAMTESGGIFFGLMDKQSQTVAGRWSALAETLEIGLRDIGLAFFDAFNIKDVFESWRMSVDGIRNNNSKLVETFTAWREVLVDIWTSIKAGYAVIRGLIRLIIDVTKATYEWITGNSDLAIGIRVFTVALISSIAIVRTAILAYTALTMVLGGIAAMWALVTSPIAGLIAAITGLTLIIYNLNGLDATFDNFGAAFSDMAKSFQDAWKGISDAVKAGDFELAFDIVMKAVHYSFKRLLLSLHVEFRKFTASIFGTDTMSELGTMAGLQASRMTTWLKVNNPLTSREDAIRIQADQDLFEMKLLREHSAQQNKAQREFDASIAARLKEADPIKAELNALIQTAQDRRIEKMAQDNIPAIQKAEQEMVSLFWETFAKDLSREGFMRTMIAYQTGGFGTGPIIDASGRLTAQGLSALAEGSRFAGGSRFELRQGGLSQAEVEGSAAYQLLSRLTGLDPRYFGRGTRASVFDDFGGTAKYGTIAVPFSFDPEAKEIVGDIRREMGKELKQGIGDVGGRMSYVNRQLELLEQAYRGPMGSLTSPMSALVGGAGISPPNMAPLINAGEYDFGRMQIIKALRRFVGSTEEILPRAMFAGSQEAQDAINRQEHQKVSVLEEIRDLFKAADIRDAEQQKEMQRTLDALKRVLEERGGIIVGGMKDG